MKAESQICERYEATFAAIASLNHTYYRNPHPSRDDRRDYAIRQEHLEKLRARFYAELAEVSK